MAHGVQRRRILEPLLDGLSEENYFSHFGIKVREILKSLPTLNELEVDSSKLNYFKWDFKKRWLKAKRGKKFFLTSYQAWLDSEIKLFEKPSANTSQSEGSTFDADQSEQTKRRKTADLRASHSADELAYAAQMKLRQEGKPIHSALVKEINFTSPLRASKIKEKIDNAPTPMTVQEAVALIINCNLSKSSYEYLYDTHKSHNSKLLPRYKFVSAAKKECYPPNITVDDMSMSVDLQSLCNHTARELLSLASDEVKQLKAEINLPNDDAVICLKILYKYGSDGSGSHARYSLPLNEADLNPNSDETHIFATFICPIKVVHKSSSSLLWHNPVPSSPIYCRPVKLEFIKEKDEVIHQEFQRMAKEIDNIHPTIVEDIIVFHEFIPTMVDGKVTQSLSGSKASSTCTICVPPTKPSQMNDLSAIKKKKPSQEMLSYGISPLHLYLNSLDLVLHLAYRIEIKVWRVMKKDHKSYAKKRKKAIQKSLKEKLAVNVDMPTQGKGNTNTGRNTFLFGIFIIYLNVINYNR